MFVWKNEYHVKLWRYKHRTPNTIDHHMPLNENTPMKIFCVRHCTMRHWFLLKRCGSSKSCASGLLKALSGSGITSGTWRSSMWCASNFHFFTETWIHSFLVYVSGFVSKEINFPVACCSVFFKVFWGTKMVSQIPPTVSQNIVTWDHINGERSLKFLQAVS